MACKISTKKNNQPKTVVVVVASMMAMVVNGQQKCNKQLEFTGGDGNGASKSTGQTMTTQE